MTEPATLYNFFRGNNAENLWRSGSPCPSCHGNTRIQCAFQDGLCAFPRSAPRDDVLFHNQLDLLRQKRTHHIEISPCPSETLPLEIELAKKGIRLCQRLCYKRHEDKAELHSCTRKNQAHNWRQLFAPFLEQETIAAFSRRLLETDTVFKPVYTLETMYTVFLCHLATRVHRCDKSPMLSVHIYTEEGQLRIPICLFFCRNCNITTYIVLYQCVNKSSLY